MWKPLRSACVALSLALGLAQCAGQWISATEARELVLVLLRTKGWTKLAGFEIDVGPYIHYYYIHAICDNPEGSNTVGHWAVDQITGDVWDSAACALYTSPALRKAQERLRKRVGLARSEYKPSRKNASWFRADQNPPTIEMGRPAWWALRKSAPQTRNEGRL